MPRSAAAPDVHPAPSHGDHCATGSSFCGASVLIRCRYLPDALLAGQVRVVLPVMLSAMLGILRLEAPCAKGLDQLRKMPQADLPGR
jgi:hypothetical protein